MGKRSKEENLKEVFGSSKLLNILIPNMRRLPSEIKCDSFTSDFFRSRKLEIGNYQHPSVDFVKNRLERV